ncbi:MAG: PQQ-binding-like beta-propeller repeat protein, partial [Planctomycetota bacterium]
VDNNGNSEIAISVIGEIWGLSNTTGKLRWYAAGVNSRNAQVSVIVDDAGVVYAVGEEGVAVRVDGKGDLTDDNTVWEGRIRTSYATPVLVGGHLFSVSGTVVECVDASTGERVFQERLSRGSSVAPAETDENVRGGDRFAGGDRSRFGGGAGGPGGFSGRGGFGSRGGFGGGRGGRGGGGDYASPVVAGDKIYITTNAGVIYVIAATPEFQQLAANDLSADASGFGGTPAVSDGRLFLRSNTHLYCIGSN